MGAASVPQWSGMPRVGILGAFSIENAGDALLGLAARQALLAALPGCAVELYAPRLPGPRWGHDFTGDRTGVAVTPVTPGEPLAWARGLDALVIGGGGLLGFGEASRPFLLGGDPAWSGPPAAWHGVCSQGSAWYGVPPPARREVARCAEQLAFVAVRGAHTERFLRGCGYVGPCRIVPDPTWLLAEGPPEGGRPVDELLEQHGVTPGPGLIGVSVGNALADPRAAGFHAALADALIRLAQTSGRQVVLLPVGAVYGDGALARAFAARVPGSIVVGDLAPLELWRLIGRLELYLGARLHGVLAALAQDVPLVILDEYFSDQTATSKLRELAVDHGLEPFYTCPLVTRDPTPKIALALAPRTAAAAEARADRRRQTRDAARAHHQAMLVALGLTPG
jgi:hypothetical protein